MQEKSNKKSRDQWFDRTTARAAVQHVQTGGPPSTVAAPAPAPAPASVAASQSQTTDSQEESTALALPNAPGSAGGFVSMHIESFPGRAPVMSVSQALESGDGVLLKQLQW